MKHKLSIGIDLDHYLKKTLYKTTRQWHDMPLRFHPEDSLHIPLISLGHVDEAFLNDILGAISSVCAQTESFDVTFEKIGPTYKNSDPRPDLRDAKALSLLGTTSEQLRMLHENLLKELNLFVKEKKEFRPHIPLGSMRAKKWQALESYPSFDVPLELTYDVTAVTLFEVVDIEGKKKHVDVETFVLKE